MENNISAKILPDNKSIMKANQLRNKMIRIKIHKLNPKVLSAKVRKDNLHKLNRVIQVKHKIL